MDLTLSYSLFRHRLVVLLALCALTMGLEAATLQQVLTDALRNSPEVRAARHARDASREELNRARSGLYPTVDMALASGREESSRLGSNAIGETRTDRTLTFSQPIYAGGAVNSEIDRQAALVTVAQSNLDQVREQVALRVVDSYLSVIRDHKLVRISGENANNFRNALKKMRDRYDSGVGTRIDVVQAESRLAQARSTYFFRENSLRQSIASYTRVVGMEPQNLEAPEYIGAQLPESFQLAQEMAIARHSGIKTAYAELRATQASLNASKADFLPSLNFNVIRSESSNAGGMLGMSESLSMMLNMKLNLFRGGSDVSRRETLFRKLFESEENLRAARRRAQEEMTAAWSEYESSQKRMPSLKLYANTANELVAAFRRQFESGRRSLQELLAIEGDSAQAQTELVSGEMTLLGLQYRVAIFSGLLTELVSGQIEDMPQPLRPNDESLLKPKLSGDKDEQKISVPEGKQTMPSAKPVEDKKPMAEEKKDNTASGVEQAIDANAVDGAAKPEGFWSRMMKKLF